jgi:hypothetical protein
MRGDRAVVDDASAARVLCLHQSHRFLCAEKSAGKVGIDDSFPSVEGNIFHCNGRRARAGIVEEKIETAKSLFRFRKQCLHGFRLGDIRRDGQRFALDQRSGFGKCFDPSPGQNNGIGVFRQSDGDRPSNATACAGDDGDLAQEKPLLNFAPIFAGWKARSNSRRV